MRLKNYIAAILLFPVMLMALVMILVAVTQVYRPDKVQAVAACYVHKGADEGWEYITCTSIRALYPNMTISEGSCYYSWGTGFGVTPPISAACGEPPTDSSTPLLPLNGTPGGAADTTSQLGNTIENQKRNQIINDPDINNNPIVLYSKMAINILSALVGIVTVGVIVVAGIQYSAAGGNPNATMAAKKRILNAIIALVSYLFLYVILNWLIPGGLF